MPGFCFCFVSLLTSVLSRRLEGLSVCHTAWNTGFKILVWKISWRKEMAPLGRANATQNHWTEEPLGCSRVANGAATELFIYFILSIWWLVGFELFGSTQCFHIQFLKPKMTKFGGKLIRNWVRYPEPTSCSAAILVPWRWLPRWELVKSLRGVIKEKRNSRHINYQPGGIVKHLQSEQAILQKRCFNAWMCLLAIKHRVLRER